MNGMKNIAERRIGPSPNKQTLSFFLIRKNMTKFASADMEKTAFFAVVNGVINERRKLVFQASFFIPKRQRISSDLSS